jgi:hypothetical protein
MSWRAVRSAPARRSCPSATCGANPLRRAFTFHAPFADHAVRLLRAPVRLYHDQAMFTEPGAVPTPWHQDAQHWAVPGDRCLTMWLALRDLDDEGTLRYASGSQRAGLLGDHPISPASQAHFAPLIAQHGWAVRSAGPMRAGDALFHDGWVIHGAPGNPTADLRAVMTVLFVAADAPLIEPQWPAQADALRTWTPDQRPGELVGSPLNPQLPF